MPVSSTIRSLLARIGRALEESDIPYMVISGQAALVYGEFRLTRDIDVTLAVSPFDLEPVLPILTGIGLRPVFDDPVAFARANHLLPMLDEHSALKVDFELTTTPYRIEAMDRAQPRQIEGVGVRFSSAEDLIVLKVIAGRPQDQQDVIGILVRQTKLDADHIRRWLHEHETVLDEPFVERFEQWRREASS